MTISELPALPRLATNERESLRDALTHRRRGLLAALRLYRDVAIDAAPRTTLIRRTELALADVDRALVRLHDPAYGVCRGCGEPLSVARLTVKPLASDCASCAAVFASA